MNRDVAGIRNLMGAALWLRFSGPTSARPIPASDR
jgi:hypothetical protein